MSNAKNIHPFRQDENHPCLGKPALYNPKNIYVKRNNEINYSINLLDSIIP